jgi:hypothetical protein
MSRIMNYSTSVPAARSVAEISQRLARHGADTIAVQYVGGEPSAIAFRIATEHGPRSFELPANVDGVVAALARTVTEKRYQGRPHAQRVAWRILKDWIEAQIAVIEAGLSTLDTVMLPYMVTPSGRTLAVEYRASAGLRAAIEAGEPA